MEANRFPGLLSLLVRIVVSSAAITVALLISDQSNLWRPAPDRPFLIARPNPIPPGGGPGRTTITWSTGNGHAGDVYRVDGDKETPVAEGSEGVREIASIAPGPPFPAIEFRLYEDRGREPVARLKVTRTDDRLSLARTAAAGSLLVGALALVFVWVETRWRTPGRTPLRPVVLITAGAIGCVVTAVVFYPGSMSRDSLDQFRQAITGVLSAESSPPIMALVWRYVVRLIPGPFGMMLVHVVVFWIGAGLVADACASTTVGAVVCVLGIGLFPPVFALLGSLWKDVGLGASLILFVGLVLAGTRRRSRALLFSAVVPLFYATAVRFNAISAVLPLACWWWWSAGRVSDTQRWMIRSPAMGGLILTIALASLSGLATRAMVTSHEDRPSIALQGSMLFDLVGISVRTGDLRLPVYLQRPEMSMDALQRWYDPEVGDNAFIYRFDFIIGQTAWHYDQLKRTWRQAVADHPRAYLRHRASVFLTAVQIGGIYQDFHRGIDANDMGLTFPRRRLHEDALRLLDRLTPWFFRGWFFLVLAAMVTARGCVRRQCPAVAVASSSILYALPYAFVSGGSDFRYVWWSVVASIASVFLLTADAVTPSNRSFDLT
jgi:hypothetical protein